MALLNLKHLPCEDKQVGSKLPKYLMQLVTTISSENSKEISKNKTLQTTGECFFCL
jgi:hypothetical protein